MRRSARIVGVLAIVTSASLVTGCSGTAPSNADRIFVSAMVPHHRLGVELLDIAVPRVDDVRLRRLVFKMSAYHESELHDLERRLTDWGVAPSVRYPGWISDDDVNELSGLAGSDYDIRWLELMIAHHEGAVTLAAAEVGDGFDSALRALARRISVAQSEEVAKMRKLRAELCPPHPETAVTVPGCASANSAPPRQ